MKALKKTVLNYRIIVKPDTRTGSDEPCFTAYCPTLGLVDDGETSEKALANLQKTIEFHLECLELEKQTIPVDSPHTELLTTTQVTFTPTRFTQFAY